MKTIEELARTKNIENGGKVQPTFSKSGNGATQYEFT